MAGARMDGSDLMGCNLSRAKLDRASLRACNFYDPAQRVNATLEVRAARQRLGCRGRGGSRKQAPTFVFPHQPRARRADLPTLRTPTCPLSICASPA